MITGLAGGCFGFHLLNCGALLKPVFPLAGKSVVQVVVPFNLLPTIVGKLNQDAHLLEG